MSWNYWEKYLVFLSECYMLIEMIWIEKKKKSLDLRVFTLETPNLHCEMGVLSVSCYGDERSRPVGGTQCGVRTCVVLN